MARIIFLKRLGLRNFKGIEKLDIDFSKNTNIYGDNGTGKTTINDASKWLLFDKDSKDKSKFDIQPLDEKNNVIHMRDTEVEGAFEIDGRVTVLKKVLKEKRVKKRGEVDAELKGTETTYYIDEVPVKQSDYKKKINNIIDENLFKLITDPLYFSTNMKWTDRRNVLMNIIGDLTVENVINYKESLKPLEKLLGDRTIDDFKKSVAATIKKLKKDKESIPARADELNNAIQGLDFRALEQRKSVVLGKIKSLEEQILDGPKVNDEVLKERDKLYSLKSKLRDVEYKASMEVDKPKRKLEKQFNDLSMDMKKIESSINNLKINKQYTENDIEHYKTLCDEERKNWFDEKDKPFEFDENNRICPTCKRAFSEEDIENKRAELENNFNANKDENLKVIRERGKSYKALLEKHQEKLNVTDSNIESSSRDLEKLKAVELELQEQIKNYVPVDPLIGNQEYQNLKTEIAELESKFQQPTETNLSELKFRKIELQKELDNINKQLAYKETNEKMKARIAELMEEERALSQRIAELEGQEFLCEEFIKTKVELLESSINSKFKYVSFKLFDTQVNGGINECCEALINGVPFSNANTASQINGGLDIINTLCNHYDVNAPIFIDNRESVNNLIETNSQIVNLIVSKDKDLRIESEVI